MSSATIEDAIAIAQSADATANSANTGANLLWTLIGGCLIFFMQSGFALLESGSVRAKNTQNILIKNLMDACISGIVWWSVGFGFAFGDLDSQGFIGTSKFFCNGFGPGDYAMWFF